MHNTWVYLSKKLYIAFMRFEIAWYQPHRRQKTYLPVSEAFLLCCLCAYSLLDILEIKSSFEYLSLIKMELQIQIFPLCLLNLLNLLLVCACKPISCHIKLQYARGQNCQTFVSFWILDSLMVFFLTFCHFVTISCTEDALNCREWCFFLVCMLYLSERSLLNVTFPEKLGFKSYW